MMSMRIKSVVALSALVLTGTALADSWDVSNRATSSIESTPNAQGFIYPTPILTESDFVETGVMFIYNDHILNYFEGDAEKVVAFIDSNIEHNNQAFVNSNIPIKRVVSGLINVETSDLWTADNTYTERLHNLADWQRSDTGAAIKQQSKYSYLVSLAGYQTKPDETTMLGQAFVGDNVSWISPYNTNPALWIERTLSHELSHSDGFKHESSQYQENPSFIARHDAAGYKCGTHGSIMFISGSRTEPFFSDPDITVEHDDHSVECGVVGESNAAQVYRDLLTTTIANSEGTFKNIQSTRAKTGVVSIYENVSVAIEGDNIEFDIVFEGGEAGDSISYVTRQGTAGLNDFQSSIGTIVHDGVNTVYSVVLPTKTDNLSESLEQFSLSLIYPNGVTVEESNSSIQATIFDKNEEVGYVEFSTTSISVDEGNTAELTINRVSGSQGVITYQVETATGSASSSDFESTSQSVSFNNGEMSKTIRINTTADNNDEQDETFTVKIVQTLHPLYETQANKIISEVKVTISSPATTVSTTTNSSTNLVAASSTSNTSSNSGQASGGSLNFLWIFMLLLVVVKRHVKAK